MSKSVIVPRVNVSSPVATESFHSLTYRDIYRVMPAHDAHTVEGGSNVILRINRLRQFGIFADYNGSGIQQFGRYNLIYGWNGTGKSTLSNVFSCLKNRALIPRFAGAQFSITQEDGASLTEVNLATSQLNVHVFNQRFINDNINWDKSVKSILLIAKEKIEDLQALERKKGELGEKHKAHAAKLMEIRAKTEALEKFLTSAAKKNEDRSSGD